MGTHRSLRTMLALVLVALLTACSAASPTPGTPAPNSSASPTPGAMSPAPSTTPVASTMEPTPTPFPSLPPTSSPISLADSPWWRLSDGGIQVGIGEAAITRELRIGEPSGLEGLGPAFANGPFRGRVVAASARGAMTDLTIIDVPSGEAAVVVSGPDILDAALDPMGTVLYWITAGGDEDAVWRMSLADGGRDRLFSFAVPAAVVPGTVLAAYVEVTAQVVLSADGHHLAAMRCRQDGCMLGVVDLPGGEVAWYQAGGLGASLLGFAEGGISLVSRCVTLPGGALADDCGALDARAAAAELARNLMGFAEIPAGWHLEVQRVAGSPPMAFQSEVVAVPDDGGEPVPFPALVVAGQG